MTSPIEDRSSFLRRVTPIILTYNEAPNIGRSLERLQRFDDVLIVDSGSTDETLSIVATFPNTRVLTRPFDSFAGQWNFALRDGKLETDWALAMDADYLLSEAFLAELARLTPTPDISGYRVAFNYCIFGKRLSTTFYRPLIVLHRHRSTQYVQDGHCMRAQMPGVIRDVKNRIDHDDRKPLARWVVSQARYAEQEAELLLNKSGAELRAPDRLRRLLFVTPWLVPLYYFTVGRGFLDGRAGLYYALQRSVAEAVLTLKLIEIRLNRKNP